MHPGPVQSFVWDHCTLYCVDCLALRARTQTSRHLYQALLGLDLISFWGRVDISPPFLELYVHNYIEQLCLVWQHSSACVITVLTRARRCWGPWPGMSKLGSSFKGGMSGSGSWWKSSWNAIKMSNHKYLQVDQFAQCQFLLSQEKLAAASHGDQPSSLLGPLVSHDLCGRHYILVSWCRTNPLLSFFPPLWFLSGLIQLIESNVLLTSWILSIARSVDIYKCKHKFMFCLILKN